MKSVCLIVLCVFCCGLVSGATATRPNVLLIIVDDLRDHEMFAGANSVAMPNLDRLAAQGLKFSHAYCQATFCNPSRTSFLTGLRPNTTGVHENKAFFRDSKNPAVAQAVTLPQHFRQNGYHTVSLGKILHGRQMDPVSWDLQINGFPETPAGKQGDWVSMTKGVIKWCRWRAPDCADDDLDDGQIALKAIDVLNEKRDKPFFLAVGFKKPHDPFVAPKRYFDRYPLSHLKLHRDPADATPVPPMAIPNNANKRAFDAMTDQERLEFLRCYAACSTYSDAQVGRILDTMDHLDLWKNTLVLVWTDHGYHQGERGWWNKTLLFDYDAKVPFMVCLPKMTSRGKVCASVIELIDVFPTVTELAGLKLPDGLEGQSFAPLIQNPVHVWNRVAHTQSGGGHNRSICNGRFRFTQWADGAVELYDHDTDPGEWYNQAGNPTYHAISAELKSKLLPRP
jgi:iduronate 2-sulfatase